MIWPLTGRCSKDGSNYSINRDFDISFIFGCGTFKTPCILNLGETEIYLILSQTLAPVVDFFNDEFLCQEPHSMVQPPFPVAMKAMVWVVCSEPWLCRPLLVWLVCAMHQCPYSSSHQDLEGHFCLPEVLRRKKWLSLK